MRSESKTRMAVWMVLEPILAVFVGLSLGFLVIAAAGKPNPFALAFDGQVLEGISIFARHFADAAWFLADGAFGNMVNLGNTLYYTVPLIFTGLSVAVAFHAGLFNIGAQGQLIVGCLAGAAFGIAFPDLPGFLAVVLGVLAAGLAGATWGAIPGWLRARTGSHEVITTIMLNFIAAGITSWITLGFLQNPDSQSPETSPVGDGFLLHPISWGGRPLFDSAAVTHSLEFAVVVALLMWIFLYHTVPGFKIRAVGQNPHAARGAGVSVGGVQTAAMALAGGLAGLVVLSEIFAGEGKFRIGIMDHGFTGIAVALLGRCHPVAIIFSAFLFGALHNGSMGLEFESEYVTQEVSMILRGLVILSVSADGIWFWLRQQVMARKEAQA